MEHHRINHLNKMLKDELGVSPTGLALFKWVHSDSWIRAKRKLSLRDDDTLEPVYEYVENPETKLFHAIPVYEQCKVVQEANDQWMMGAWLDNGSFDGFRKQYGDNLEWNKQGEYWPVTVDKPTGGIVYVSMAPGKVPTTDDTWKFIHTRRKDLKEVREFEARMIKLRQDLERSEFDKLTGMIMDKLPSFFGVPGSRSFSHEIGIGQKLDPRGVDNSIFERKH